MVFTARSFIPTTADFPAEIRFVHLSETRKRVIRAGLKHLAQVLEHKLGGFLPNPQLLVQSHTGYTLEVSGEQVDANGPAAITDLGVLHHRPRHHAEHGTLATFTAAVVHCGMLDIPLDVVRPAIGHLGVPARRSSASHAFTSSLSRKLSAIPKRLSPLRWDFPGAL